MVLEAAIEKYLDDEVTRRGGMTIKLTPEGRRGIPDRLVLLPGGVVLFVELKRPRGGVVAKLQKMWQSALTRLGFPATYAKTKEDVDALLREHAPDPETLRDRQG